MRNLYNGNAILRELMWDCSPIEAFHSIGHLPGLVFFDSADARGKVSILAAKPIEVVRGGLESLDVLLELAEKFSFEATDLGFPMGGLCGWVDYEGKFCFGVYPEMLIYLHDTCQWFEVGSLSQSVRKKEKDSLCKIEPWSCLFGEQGFIQAVKQAQEYIKAGDIYQVNLARKFEAQVTCDNLHGLYEALRNESPAPMASYAHLGNREVLSSSPELFLHLSGKQIETRPIKGTRPRYSVPERDISSIHDLLSSEKELAELVMITDLERNDLGKICEYGSIRVKALAQLESFAQVHHLVSTVTGCLRPEVSHIEAFKACFPGGSITGAPKKRAREIITELEPVPRGLYTGAIGYFGFNGESQFNISIRTLVRDSGRLSYHVGAGIVSDSIPKKELAETEQKSTGIRLALQAWLQ